MKKKLAKRRRLAQETNSTLTRFRCLPYIYVIGMYKAGSTDLFSSISKHPQIIKALTKSSQYPKSTINFKDYMEFLDPVADRIRISPSSVTLDAYASLFKLRRSTPGSKPVKFESGVDVRNISHLYLSEIQEQNPNAYFLLALRDPVTWIYSAYNFWLHRGTSPHNFHIRMVKGIRNLKHCVHQNDIEYCVINNHIKNVGQVENRVFEMVYYVFVKEILKVIPKEKLIIIRAENYYKNRDVVLNNVFRKLGMEEMNKRENTNIKGIKVKNSRHYRPMLKETELLLREFVRPYNARLANLLENEEFKWPTN